MSRETCDICGQELEPVASVGENDPEVEALALPDNYLPCGMIESRRGPLFVCEGCYRKGQFKKYDAEDLYDLHYAFGVEYRAMDRLDDSLACFQKAVGIEQTPEALVMMAGLYAQLGQPEREIAMYDRAVKLDPEDVLARRGLASALRTRGRYDEALALVEGDLEQMGALPDLMMERAELLYRLGRSDAALLSFQAAKASASSDADREEFELRWSKVGL